MSSHVRTPTSDARFRRAIEESTPDTEGRLIVLERLLTNLPPKHRIMHVIPAWHYADPNRPECFDERPYCGAKGVPFEAKTVYVAEEFPRERDVALCIDCLTAFLRSPAGIPYRSARYKRRLQYERNRQRYTCDVSSKVKREEIARKSARPLAKASEPING